MENLEMLMDYIERQLDKENRSLTKYQEQMKNPMSLGMYSEKCLEIERSSGVISGLEKAKRYTHILLSSERNATTRDYRELQSELAEVCLMQEVDADAIAIYTERVAALEASGVLSDSQLNILNAYIEELTLNWVVEE